MFFFSKINSIFLAVDVDGLNADEILLNKSTVNGPEMVSEETMALEETVKMRKIKWKYVIFFAIWLLSAWHLLTVEEQVLINHDIFIDAKHTKSASLHCVFPET